MTEAPAAILNMAGVTKSYGTHQALRGVDLRIGPGELVGLLGPNGAGKSTLFQICSGLFAADSGTVDVFGTTFRQNPGAILSQLGVVFQSRSLDLDTSVKANLKFHGGMFGFFGRSLRLRIEEVATLMDITDLMDRQVRKLSGGNQRRVEIARALMSQPRLLLLDEPSAGLDATARLALVRNLRNIVSTRGMSILWATHLVDEVAEADRIVLLMAGKVTHEGTPEALVAQSGATDLTGAYVALTGVKPPPATGFSLA
jgi:ABC-2 type transport system ATP-binding protein